MTTDSRPDSLSIVVFSEDFERVHYALVMASAAAALGTPATLFFTMGATRALIAPGTDGEPGWRTMPAMDGRSGGEADDTFKTRGVATFEDLLSACIDLDVRFLVCEMGLKALGIERTMLRSDVALADGGVATFLNGASRDGSMLFI